jgi:hypothetical protein
METDHPAFQTGLAKSSTAPSQGDGTYNTSIGYLRAFVTLLVLAHLSMLAYCKFAPQPPVSCWLSPIGG